MLSCYGFSPESRSKDHTLAALCLRRPPSDQHIVTTRHLVARGIVGPARHIKNSNCFQIPGSSPAPRQFAGVFQKSSTSWRSRRKTGNELLSVQPGIAGSQGPWQKRVGTSLLIPSTARVSAPRKEWSRPAHIDDSVHVFAKLVDDAVTATSSRSHR